MKHYKKAIKKHLQNLPCGESVLLPAARFIIRYILHPRYSLYRLKKWADEKKEADYLLKRLQADNFDEAVIIYDLKVSPPTYGDFLYVVMIARFFLIQNRQVKFLIIVSEFRKDTLEAYKGYEERNRLVECLAELPEVILKDENCYIKTINWPEFTEMMDDFEKSEKSLVVFKHKVIKRESIYDNCFNLSNRLFSFLTSDQVNKFLLCKDEIGSRVEIKYPQTPYITWAARYSVKWGYHRNITKREFIEIHRSLHSLYPNHAIMIVSDETGCAYFKKLAQENNLSCLFSKDFSATFMGDCALVIGSDYYFQLRGGGIGLAAIYSSLPHCIIGIPEHETVWKENCLAVWAHKTQIYKTATEGLPE